MSWFLAPSLAVLLYERVRELYQIYQAISELRTIIGNSLAHFLKAALFTRYATGSRNVKDMKVAQNNIKTS